jgi:ATP-binding cassette, subfamily B, bacterial PglK
MYNKLTKLTNIIFKNYNNEIIFLQFLIIFSSLIQILSILSFAPFIMMISDPAYIELLSEKYKFLSSYSQEEILFYSILSITGIFILSNLLSIYVSKITIFFCQKVNIDFSNNIFKSFLSKEYSYHLENNSSELISKITQEIGRVIVNILNPLLQLNSKIISVIFILIGLSFLTGIKSILFILVIILFAYYIFFLLYKKQLKKNSELISKNLYLRQKSIKESLENIKETKLFQAENFFLDMFSESNSLIAKSIAKNQILSILPKFLIEIIGIIFFMLFIFYKLNTGQNLNEILPLLSVYLVAGYKMLPAIQSIATSYAAIRGNITAIEKVESDLDSFDNNNEEELNYNHFNFNQINVLNLKFSYKKKLILDDVSLNLKKNQITAIVGKTGEGKTTLINLIAGLLEPSNGTIKFDDNVLSNSDKKKIITKIGYVSQKVSLIEDTISNNITLGVKEKDIDKDKINYIAKITLIDEFTSQLKNKFETTVGENGILLSGGQVQRIGLARALYKEPALLIIDEGTSGLDANTEKKIFQNLQNIKKNICILMITHRNEVLKYCDTVYEIKNTKINKLK